MLTKKDMGFITHGYEFARNSEFQRARMSCIAVYKGKILCHGVNSHKTHPLQNKYNIFRDDFDDVGDHVLPKVHAEMDCVAQLRSIIEKRGVHPNDITLYIVRACKNRKYGMARPCKACMRAIYDLGIRKLVYTTDVGFAKEQIANG